MFAEVMIRIALQKVEKVAGGLGGGGSPPHDVRRSDDSNRGAIKSLSKI